MLDIKPEFVFTGLFVVCVNLWLYFKNRIAEHLQEATEQIEMHQLALEQKHYVEQTMARRLYDLRIAMKYLPQMIKQGMVSNISITQDKGMQLVANSFTIKLIEKQLENGNESFLPAWEYAKENNYKILSK